MKHELSRVYTGDFCSDFTCDFFFWAMKKSGSVINVLVLGILIATFLGDILLRIIQKDKIGPKNHPCSRGFSRVS